MELFSETGSGTGWRWGMKGCVPPKSFSEGDVYSKLNSEEEEKYQRWKMKKVAKLSIDSKHMG